MVDGWKRIDVTDLETNLEKPGERWELSPQLGIDDFNLNVATLECGERLSQNHFHYHENQKELFYVVDGSCRVVTWEDRFTMSSDELVVFQEGKDGAHVVHNPFEEPCKLVAIGWPPDGRYPVHQLRSLEDVRDSLPEPTDSP
ncbi:cupin domain-containing protein [Halopiger aswanensis]|uniref:Putative cupin superfamily protein n=1 Tax=Halopiger aswanensis TaxID=148449 RepID=A0A3R7DWJ4_9EURY|nr:cupin domain-containing protein [Halopiger aswanensis]RKD88025.1 putative cupin superfamily protein [Halopiger aswanensis]